MTADDCACEFDPYDDDPDGEPEESWHYKRTCGGCGDYWWALHCPHDGAQNPCPHCDWLQAGAVVPLVALGLAR